MNQAIVDRLEALLSAANREIDRLKDRQLDLDGVDCGRCLELTEKIAVLEKEREATSKDIESLRSRLMPEEERRKLEGDVLYAESALATATAECGVLKEKVASLEQQFGNLLARIHRDGGHYAEEHGWSKAGIDAETMVVREREQRDRLIEALAQAVHTFADFRTTLLMLRHEGASQAAGIAEDCGSQLLDEIAPGWREKP